jgi:hypothetical protein
MAECTKTVKPGEDLRQAILSLPEGGVLCFEAGTYAAPIRIEQSATLRPATAGSVVVLDAEGRGPVFATGAMDAKIVMDGLELRGGAASEAGGAVRVEGASTVTLRGCGLLGNRGGSYGGGAVYANDGATRLERCRIEGNAAEKGSAAVLADGTARVELDACLVAGNDAGAGPVVRVLDGARLQVRATTFADNTGASLIALEGTTTRAPHLEVDDAILTHAHGPLVHRDSEPPHAHIHIARTVLHGQSLPTSAEAANRTGDPKLAARTSATPYRPADDSPARGLAQAPPAGAVKTDLHGKARPKSPAAGAIE